MKVLLVDDEAPARSRLAGLLRDAGLSSNIIEACNGAEALEQVHAQRPDVVLLDIRMPVMDGLEAARHMAALRHPPAVIFTTAYDEYALKAFEAHAIDYLLKPVRADRLADAMGRAQTYAGLPDDLGVDADGKPTVRTFISATLKHRIQLIPVADIRYFQADQKYVTVGWPGGEVLIEDSLKSLEREFADRFVRIHRNALIACKYLTGLEIQGDSCRVALDGVGGMPAVSRRHLPQVRKLLKAF